MEPGNVTKHMSLITSVQLRTSDVYLLLHNIQLSMYVICNDPFFALLLAAWQVINHSFTCTHEIVQAHKIVQYTQDCSVHTRLFS